MFLFASMFRQPLGPPDQLFSGLQNSRSPAVKGMEREAEHSTPSGVQVTNAWYYLHSLKYLLDMVRNLFIYLFMF
jgi:hypothetical protein